MSEIQLNVRISEGANERLLGALGRHSGVTKQSIIEDLLLLYLDHWEELQGELMTLKQNWVREQMKRVEKRQAG